MQFFICFNDANWLDGQYTIWGEVVEGMDLIDGLKKGLDQSGMVTDPDKMLKVTPIKE